MKCKVPIKRIKGKYYTLEQWNKVWWQKRFNKVNVR